MKIQPITMTLLAAHLAAACGSSGKLQFTGPLDYDYDQMRTVQLTGTDDGGVYRFHKQYDKANERTLYVPEDSQLHKRELYVYDYEGQTLWGNMPAREYTEQRVDTTTVMSFKVRRAPMTVTGVRDSYHGPIELEINVEQAENTEQSVMQLYNQQGDTLALIVDKTRDCLSIRHRGQTTDSKALKRAVDEPDVWRLRAYISHGSVEVFVNDGRLSLSCPLQLSDTPRTVTLRSVGGQSRYTGISFYTFPAE